jgi:hypothetical protein
MFEFKCGTCGKFHQGIPSFGWDYPIQYLEIPEDQRDYRCRLGTDDCVIDEKNYFIRGCLDIHIHGEDEPFSWGVWISLSEKSYSIFSNTFLKANRSMTVPLFGWLCSYIWVYQKTLNLKAHAHLRDNGIRPYIELEPTDHPLAVEQRQGISKDRVAEIYEMMTHPEKFKKYL